MKTYIGTKIVNAEPMDQLQFRDLHSHPNYTAGIIVPIDDHGNPRDGYKVVYEDGYVSWSPKETFERAYREVTDAEKTLIGKYV